MRLHLKILKLIIIFSIVVMFMSCEQTSLSSTLCGDNIRYWEYEEEDNQRFPIYFLFDKNGRWLPLEQDEQGNVKKYVLSCQIYNEKWSLQDDSILYLGWNSKGYTVQRYSDSCVLLKQGERIFKMRSIDNLQDAVQWHTKRYRSILDSIMSINYEIIVDSMIQQGQNYYVLGTAFNGEKKYITLNKEEGCTLDPHKNDSLIKKKNWVLINKVTADSVFLYNYFISSRNCFLLKSSCDIKNCFMPNTDGVFVLPGRGI